MRDTKTLRKIGQEFFGDDEFLTNVEYRDEHRRLGELDIYGFKDDTLCIMEYKYIDNNKYRKKAIDQLLRAEKYATITGVPYVLIYAHRCKKTKDMAELEFMKHFDGKRVKYDKLN